jgi:Rieske Fe-S protein
VRNVPVGAVYLVRQGNSVTAFNVVCPHAGCFVDVAPAGSDATFACPCHRSTFRADGSLVPGSVSPRGLDRLDVDREALAAGEVRVKFQNFEAGRPDKKTVG